MTTKNRVTISGKRLAILAGIYAGIVFVAGLYIGRISGRDSPQGPDAARRGPSLDVDNRSEEVLRTGGSSIPIGRSSPEQIQGSTSSLANSPATKDAEFSIPLPRKFWGSSIVSPLNGDLEVSKDVKKLLGLSKVQVKDLQSVLDGFKEKIRRLEALHIEGYPNEGQTAIIIRPWNDDAEAMRSELQREIAGVIGDESAEFFLAQSENMLRSVTGGFGGEGRLIRVFQRDDGTYFASVMVAENIADISSESLLGRSDLVLTGRQISRTLRFDEIPKELSHLFEDR